MNGATKQSPRTYTERRAYDDVRRVGHSLEVMQEVRSVDLDSFRITQPDEDIIDESIEILEGFREFQRDTRFSENV